MNFLQEYFMKTQLERNKIIQSEIISTHCAKAQERERGKKESGHFEMHFYKRCFSDQRRRNVE